MTETTFQYVSVSKLSYTSFTDRSYLPMVPLAPLALTMVPLVLSMVPLASLVADTVQGSMVAIGTNGKITSGANGGIICSSNLQGTKPRKPGENCAQSDLSPFLKMGQIFQRDHTFGILPEYCDLNLGC